MYVRALVIRERLLFNTRQKPISKRDDKNRPTGTFIIECAIVRLGLHTNYNRPTFNVLQSDLLDLSRCEIESNNTSLKLCLSQVGLVLRLYCGSKYLYACVYAH